MSYNIVRAAFVASVTWDAPPVSRQIRNVSTVPNANSPASARTRAPSILSSSHATFVAEKYGSSNRPVRALIKASCPASFNARHMSAVRRSCQTIALWITSPVVRSQINVVSRWLVMPMAVMSRPWAALRIVSSVVRQICSGLCSTQPEAGKCWVNSCCALATGRISASKTMAREDVVP